MSKIKVGDILKKYGVEPKWNYDNTFEFVQCGASQMRLALKELIDTALEKAAEEAKAEMRHSSPWFQTKKPYVDKQSILQVKDMFDYS